MGIGLLMVRGPRDPFLAGGVVDGTVVVDGNVDDRDNDDDGDNTAGSVLFDAPTT